MWVGQYLTITYLMSNKKLTLGNATTPYLIITLKYNICDEGLETRIVMSSHDHITLESESFSRPLSSHRVNFFNLISSTYPCWGYCTTIVFNMQISSHTIGNVLLSFFPFRLFRLKYLCLCQYPMDP